MKRQSYITDEELRTDIRNALYAINYIVDDSLIVHRAGKDTFLMRTNNIIPQLGSCVILDATATVNETYNTAAWHQSDSIKHVETVSPRNYKNFTIHKAIGYHQGKTSIYEDLPANEIRRKALEYLQTAASILLEGEKLLIIAHKEFKIALEAQCNQKNIAFTHWGNHIGKNEWSDCNKVMIIGWNYIKELEHWGNHVNAVGSIDNACYDAARNNYNPNLMAAYKTTQLADDLVQAISRCSVRKTISEDGNCSPSAAYVFCPDNTLGRAVMELVEAEFNGCNVAEWTPVAQKTTRKIPNSKKNIQVVLNCLDHLSKSHADVNQAKISAVTGLTGAVVSRTVKEPEFIDALQQKRYSISGKGRYKLFILK